MITAITFHAIDRLRERRGITHIVDHLDMIRSCNLPSNGEFEHKDGWRYVVRDGVLVTVLPPTRETVKKQRNGELLHYLTKYYIKCPNIFELEVKNGSE